MGQAKANAEHRKRMAAEFEQWYKKIRMTDFLFDWLEPEDAHKIHDPMKRLMLMIWLDMKKEEHHGEYYKLVTDING